MTMDLPDAVFDYVRSIFSIVNDAVSKKISLIPNIPEESLDISFIESLSEHSAPHVVCPGWAIRMSSHFIGSIRHHRRYEVADIGVVVVFKQGIEIIKRKLVLLQSKRLYPNNFQVIELDEFDYGLGLAMVTGGSRHEAPIFSNVLYKFDKASTYGALRARSQQCQTIQEHFDDTDIPVHYMLYNPVVLPWQFSYPVNDRLKIPPRKLGTRIIDMNSVHSTLESKTGSLRVSDIGSVATDYAYGSSLEDFFVEVIKCKEGYAYDSERDAGLRRLFNRKSGPIFCIVAIVIEGAGE